MSRKAKTAPAEVAIVMGSKSDWPIMENTAQTLDQFNIAYTSEVVSAHRTPKKLYLFAERAQEDGIKIIIAGAGGAAHLPGMIASLTTVPVLGVPITTKSLNGVDSLLSIVQMPAGVPVGCLAIGRAGAINAALLAVQILSQSNPALLKKIAAFRASQTNDVLKNHKVPT